MGQKLIHNPKTGRHRFITPKRRKAYLDRGWVLGASKSLLDEFYASNKPIEKTNIRNGGSATKNWKIVDPSGKVYLISNLARFCRTRKVVVSWVRNSLHGWKCEEVSA